MIGVPDFSARSSVDVVHVASGAAPRTGEVLTEAQNARQGLLRGRAGDIAEGHRAPTASTRPLRDQRRGPQHDHG